MKILKDIFTQAQRALISPRSKARKALKAKYLDHPETLRAFQVGFIENSLKKKLPTEQAIVSQLQDVGFLEHDNELALANCIVIPAWNDDGNLIQAFGYNIEENQTVLLNEGVTALLNSKALKVFDELIIVQSAWELLSLYSIGIKNVITGFSIELLEHIDPKKKLVFTYEFGELPKTAIETRILKLPDLPNVNDCCDFVANLYSEKLDAEAINTAFQSLVSSAAKFGYQRPKEDKLTLVDQSNDDLLFVSGKVAYRLRGLFANKATTLKLVLTIESAGASHTDRLDLYAAKSRQQLAQQAAQKLKVKSEKIEDDLGNLIPMLEALLSEAANVATAPSVPQITARQRKKAESFLRLPNLLERIADDLETLGYVGETKNKQLAYIVATSRQLRKPLSTIVRSESGAGKSFLMECVSELIPPEELYYFSRLTSQSLYYMGRDRLKHKLLIVDERNGSEESEYPIRTLQTKRKLTLAVPMKNPKNGEIETREVTINGPIAYMESTTSTKINPENENRSFELYLDESPQQTQRIFQAQMKARTTTKQDGSKRDNIAELHHNAQRILEPITVVIPFAENLNFPTMGTRARRDVERLFSLVEAIAFLHQKQRKQIQPGVIEATVEDYAIAYELAKDSLSHAWADLPRSANQLIKQIKKMIAALAEQQNKKAAEITFLRRDVRAYTQLPDHIVKRGMQALEELEYVHVKRSSHGSRFSYQLAVTPPVVDVLAGLTKPGEIKLEHANVPVLS